MRQLSKLENNDLLWQDFGKVVDNAKEMILSFADVVCGDDVLRKILEEAQDLEQSSEEDSTDKTLELEDGLNATAFKLGNFFNRIFTP